VDSVYGDKTLKKTTIYAILKKMKAGENTAHQKHLNPKKRTRIPMSSPLSPLLWKKKKRPAGHHQKHFFGQ
jgi:hypothetical protein